MSGIGRQISTKLVRTDMKSAHPADLSASLELNSNMGLADS